MWDRKERKRENYKWSTAEGFRYVKWNRGTEELTWPTAAVLKTKLRPHSWDTWAKRWRHGWASSEKIIREELGKTVEKSDLDRTHRIGAFKEDKSKCRPIIVKFSRYNVRDKVFKNKKKLKGKGYSITEILTALRVKKLTKARNSFGFTNVWTQDGKILCKEDSRIKVFFD